LRNILIIIAPEYAGPLFKFNLVLDEILNANFSYEIQEEPKGLAEAFIIGENFIGKDDVTLIFGR